MDEPKVSRWKLKLVFYGTGLVLLVGSLLGAHALSTAHSGEPAKSPSASRQSGPVVLGTVDSFHQPIPYLLPPVLQSGTIAKRSVNDGDAVKAGDTLYVFDTTPLESSLEVAKRAVDVAASKRAEAEKSVFLHEGKVQLARLAVTAAEQNKVLKKKLCDLIQHNLEDYWLRQNPKLTRPELDDKLANADTYYAASADLVKAANEWEFKKLELRVLEDSKLMLDLEVKYGEAVVKQAKAEVAKAQSAIDLCTIKAKIDGVIEQVTISEGSTLGIGTQKPALWLIPAGPRIVRAEIEADFAHMVTNELLNREVTIFDNTNPKFTYRGKVTRIGGTFLPKRSSAEGPLAAAQGTLALEADIEVIDPAPAGRPPLRVGQRVRVDLGQ